MDQCQDPARTLQKNGGIALSFKFLGRLLGLAMLLGSAGAHAQRVVVLEFRNDKAGKVRTQIERALRSSHSVDILSLRQYKAAAAKKSFKGARAMTPAAVAKTAKAAGLSAAVGGSAGKTVHVQIWDSSGAELSTLKFPLKHGSLSQQDTRHLADAVVSTVGARKPSGAAKRAPSTASVEPPVESPKAEPTASAVEQKEEPLAASPKAEVTSAKSDSSGREQQLREELAEAHTTSPSTAPSETMEVAAKGPRVGPSLIHAQVTGTTTWRSYCSRPGFTSCAQYNALDPSQRPPGDTVDFKAQVPYVGFSLAAELFPFAESSSLLHGFGLLAGYERGFSQTNVNIVTSAGTTGNRQVYAADQALTALAAFRYFFALGQEEPLVGYAGIHGGFGTRRFDVDSSASVPQPLPGSHRNYPVVGIDVSVPIWKFLRVEGSGNYFLSPKPSSSEINNYGSTVSSSGWGADLGLAGDIWGPFGYVARLRYSQYKDHFTGSGAQWQNGGAAEESYLGLYWGASAHF